MKSKIKLKRWDSRPDGKVFWKYNKAFKNGERWLTLEQALIEQKKDSESAIKRHHRNSENINKKRREMWRNDLEGNRKTKRDQMRNRRRSNPLALIAERVRSRLRHFIKCRNYSKPSKTQEILGCDWSHLKSHLESQFTKGMSWANRNLWHIDHIIPLASAKSIEEVIKLSHYTNLQPLWAVDNFKKGAKL
jgi:hypothetical protein